MESSYAILFLDGSLAGKAFPLDEAEVTLGRSRANQITLDDAMLSRRHVAFRLQGDDVMVEDLGSTHGTFLNDKRLRGIISLQQGDVVTIGDQRMRFVTRETAEQEVGALTPLADVGRPTTALPVEEESAGDEEAPVDDRTRFAGELEAMDTQYHALDEVVRRDDEDDEERTRDLIDQQTRMLDAGELQGLKPGREEGRDMAKTAMGVLLIVGLLGGGLYLVKNVLGKEKAVVADQIRYQDIQHGFSLDFPGPWFKAPGTGGNVINFNKLENNQKVASLEVHVDRSLDYEIRGLTMGFEDYREVLEQRYGDDLKIRAPTGMEVGGLPVLAYGFYDSTHQGKGIFIISGDTLYNVETLATREHYPAVSKLFTALLKTFQIDQPDVVIDFPAPDDEMRRMALGQAEKLRAIAEQERKFAQSLWKRKDVRPENLYRAVKAYQSVMQMLAALGTKPSWGDEAGRELATVTKELQDAIRESKFQIRMAEKVKDAKTIYWESAKLMQMIPDKTDPVYQYAYKRNEYYKSKILR